MPAGGHDNVPRNATVTFRGIKNLDGALDWAFEHGLHTATEFLPGVIAAPLFISRVPPLHPASRFTRQHTLSLMSEHL